MALFNSFQFGDVDSKDYGVYISGDSVYDSPARSVDLVQVPGRNGALALDNGYYENIEVTYPAGSFGTSQEEWREKMLGIRNALAAQRGYQKLIDTYHPEHYRLGMFFAGISASPVQYNRAGQFPIRFNCKPQRFLISGDEAVEFTADGQDEVYGPSSIASFEAEEGAEIRELTVDLEPVQDLNGYDSPWPAGGGKNLLPIPTTASTSNGVTVTPQADGTVKVTTTTVTSNTEILLGTVSRDNSKSYAISGCPSGGSTSTYRQLIRLYANGSSLQTVSDTGSGYIVPTTLRPTAEKIKVSVWIASGQNNLTFIFKPMVELGSTATSFAPYSNICPISGHAGVNVYRTGKNFYNKETGLSGIWAGNYGNEILSSTNAYSAIVPCVPNKQYRITKTLTSRFRVSFTTKYPEVGDSAVNLASNDSATSIQVTTGDNARYLVIYCYYKPSDEGTISQADVAASIQVELGATATPYVVGQGTTYSISLGQTVYGGTLNVTTGELTVDRQLFTLDGTETWVLSENSKRAQTTIYRNQIKHNASNNTLVDGDISNLYPQVTGTNTYNGVLGFSIAIDGTIHVSDGSGAMNIADFKTALSTQNLNLILMLATPTTVQLTATQVSTLLGQNNIWSDSGEVEVKVASPVDLTNPTNFPAKPLIRIYGNGSVQVGDTIATVQNNADGYVDIDCESMNCYDTTGGRNADVSFSGNDFPELASGNNSILLTGPSKVEITPRWWEL